MAYKRADYPQVLNRDQIYEFDLNGYIVIKNMLREDEIDHLNRLSDQVMPDARARHFPLGDPDFYNHDDPAFLDLMIRPKTLMIVNQILGVDGQVRLDHMYAIQQTKDMPVEASLHGGPLKPPGEHRYQWFDGRMYNGMIVIMYALADVDPGNGGFICVPGSHKANMDHKPDESSHLVIHPYLKAGDMLIFTEALVHGSSQWHADHMRRSLLYKYTPGYTAWHSADKLQPLQTVCRSDLQREIIRRPKVGREEHFWQLQPMSV